MDRPSKRRRRSDGERDATPTSLSRPISPPRLCRGRPAVSSPWQLTRIQDLPEDLNRDTITLAEIVGDPLIRELWQFNFLFDLPFLMNALDPDVRNMVNVHIVHGFWKTEDAQRQMLVRQASQYANVELHAAFMPEMFGTHHSKMMVLIRHDDTAQVVIHTANLIVRDWSNMTNAVWRSPLLPKLKESSPTSPSPSIGSGQRFKMDLLSYLTAYNHRRPTCKSLVDQLSTYDFSQVKAALVASVPGRHGVNDLSETAWGWLALKSCLKSIHCSPGESNVVVQISSIATLGAKDDWLQKTLFDSLSTCDNSKAKRPQFRIVFPTADEIRHSLDGYSSGASIHTKIQSQQQAKQLQYLRPILHHWSNDSREGLEPSPGSDVKDGGRARAAPHIKTYIRYNDQDKIDWAMLTSANLSKQAWGEATSATGQMRIASWEIGVLVWPDLYGQGSEMVGTFKSDIPVTASQNEEACTSVGIRIPYSMPLQRYGPREEPWVASMNHTEPDRFGHAWVV